MKRRKKSTVCIVAGLILIVAAMILTLHNVQEDQQAEAAVTRIVANLEEKLPEEVQPAVTTLTLEQVIQEEELPDYVRFPEKEMPVETIDGIDYIGILKIPVLDLELPIISQWGYSELRKAPCRYSGSAYTEHFTICAHNYVSHFRNLRNLMTDDLVTFTDIEGNEFTYRVIGFENLNPEDVEEMEEGIGNLTLFTCTMGGSMRMAVRCEQVEYK